MAYRDYSQPVVHQATVQPTGPTHFSGEIRKVIFANPPFAILAVKVAQADFTWDTDEITVKGDLGAVAAGERYDFEGQLITDPRYGFEFAFSGFRHRWPHNADEMARFLNRRQALPAAEADQAAQIIYQQLGDQAMQTLLAAPDTVLKLTGLTKGAKQALQAQFQRLGKDDQASKANRRLMQLGFADWMIRKIQEHYQERTLQVLDQDLYQLVADYAALGISFRQVDEAARQYQGVDPTDPRRIKGALLFTALHLVNENAGSYVNPATLVQKTLATLTAGDEAVGAAQVQEQLAALVAAHQLYQADQTGVYPALYHQAEQLIAQQLATLLQGPALKPAAQKRVHALVDEVAAQGAVNYDDQQKRAIEMALTSPVLLLTGGPGTGKTTILNGIVHVYQRLLKDQAAKTAAWADGEPIQVVAPTGRAAKQARSVIKGAGVAASTIHHFLGLTTDGDAQRWIEHPHSLEQMGEMLIVDEMSMTSTLLMAGLMAVLKPGVHLILVGDVDQLPSVGPGQVFRDLLRVTQVPQVRLTHIYRQAADSTLIPLAKRINDGQVDAAYLAPQPATKYAKRIFVPSDEQSVAKRVGQMIDAYQAQHDLSIMDLQVLTPLRKQRDLLNTYLQDHLNPASLNQGTYRLRNRELRVGDKVMQTTNDPDQEVYNGDLGLITTIRGTDKNVINGGPKTKKRGRPVLQVKVDFGDKIVKYEDPAALANLELAYSMTIHKAQGSQAPVVFVTLFNSFFPRNPQAGTIIQRNLLYTAVTRASRGLVMIGDVAAFVRCAQTPITERPTSLAAAVTAAVTTAPDLAPAPTTSRRRKAAPYLTAALVAAETIDPLIGMTGVTPAKC